MRPPFAGLLRKITTKGRSPVNIILSADGGKCESMDCNVWRSHCAAIRVDREGLPL